LRGAEIAAIKPGRFASARRAPVQSFPVFRSVAWLTVFAVILGAWVWLYMMAIGMGLDVIGRPNEMAQRMAAMDPRMDMYMPMAEFGPLFGMWAAMMAAMMLPTMVPTMMTYEQLMVSADGTRAGWVGVMLGYFIALVAFAALLAGVQLALLFGGVIDMLGIAKNPLYAAALLVIVGAFQFTRAKEICHGVCHSPMTYFLGHWRTGFAGGLRMGLGLGAFCVGCCWGFMALGFVGGMMSLLWMGLATLFMVLEKLPQIGHHCRKPAGFLLIAAGIALGAAGLGG
jgi:predicted metal-binding membrane protein